MKAVRYGIIGCGAISDWHANAIIATENAVLTGVADVKYENAKKFADRYSVKCFDSVAEMLAGSEIDAVCVCTPSGFHAENALQCIEAGKHVLVEKPLAVTDEDCKKLIEKAKEKGVCAGVISQHRFSPAIRELKKLVEDGKLGKLITGYLINTYYRSQEYYDSSSWRGTWALDGGSLMNQGIHGVDVLLYIMGEVKSVSGYTKTLAHNMEAEDTSSAALEFESGALAIMQSTTAIYNGQPRQLSVSGTKGTVTIVGDSIHLCDLEDKSYVPQNVEVNINSGGYGDPKAINNDGHNFQLQDFTNAILEGRQSLIPFFEGMKTVEVINAVYRSARTGQKIILG